MERNKAVMKEKTSLDGLNYLNQNAIIKNIICQSKKHNEILLTKNKMDLNNRKMKNHPPTAEVLA